MLGILVPAALIALPLLAVVLALYLLKLRRPVAPVGSLHLWESLTRDREANSLWQRLHVSWLMILQLLVLLALILAVARPWVPSSEPVGRHSIIVVDVSASMGAMDADARGNKTRLQAARDRATNLVDTLPQDGSATLIAADIHASVIVPATGDKSRLRDALSKLTPQASGTDMTEALKLARAMAARQANSAVWILSDGDFPPAAEADDPIPAEVKFEVFGRPSANQGVSALSLQQQPGSLQLFAQIINADSITVTRRLDLSVDDSPWTAKTVTIAPGASQELVIDDVPIDARVIKAALSGQDRLAIDDAGWVTNRASTPGNVLLVSAGNKFLETALSLLPNVNLYEVAPADYKPADNLNGAPVDLTVLDAGVPSSILDQAIPGNVLMIAPTQTNKLINVAGNIVDPVPGVANPDEETQNTSQDPLLRFVNLTGVHVSRAVRLQTPGWGRVVLNSDQGPLLIVGQDGQRKLGALAFDLHDSDLPLQTAYPLLMRNLITALLPDPTSGLPASVAPGSPVSVAAASPKVDRVVIENPDAKQETLTMAADRRQVALADTQELGVYYVSQYAGEELVSQEAFAANLFLRDESMIAPNLKPPLPEGQPAVAVGAGSASAEPFQREIWPFVAMLGLFLLLMEWLYSQRIAVRRALTEWQTKRALGRADRT